MQWSFHKNNIYHSKYTEARSCVMMMTTSKTCMCKLHVQDVYLLLVGSFLLWSSSLQDLCSKHIPFMINVAFSWKRPSVHVWCSYNSGASSVTDTRKVSVALPHQQLGICDTWCKNQGRLAENGVKLLFWIKYGHLGTSAQLVPRYQSCLQRMEVLPPEYSS